MVIIDLQHMFDRGLSCPLIRMKKTPDGAIRWVSSDGMEVKTPSRFYVVGGGGRKALVVHFPCRLNGGSQGPNILYDHPIATYLDDLTDIPEGIALRPVSK